MLEIMARDAAQTAVATAGRAQRVIDNHGTMNPKTARLGTLKMAAKAVRKGALLAGTSAGQRKWNKAAGTKYRLN